MSVKVGLDELEARVREFGPGAFLVSVNLEGAPHTTSVAPRWEDGRLVAGVGNRTAANTAAHPVVTLLFTSADAAAQYCLVVDGRASVDDAGPTVTVEPVAAVLHRLATATGDGPSCIKVLERP